MLFIPPPSSGVCIQRRFSSSLAVPKFWWKQSEGGNTSQVLPSECLKAQLSFPQRRVPKSDYIIVVRHAIASGFHMTATELLAKDWNFEPEWWKYTKTQPWQLLWKHFKWISRFLFSHDKWRVFQEKYVFALYIWRKEERKARFFQQNGAVLTTDFSSTLDLKK